MSHPKHAFSVLMNNSRAAAGGGKKRKTVNEVIEDEDEVKENEDNELRYLLLLKARHREAFKLKFLPLIRANGSTIVLGGRDGSCWLINGYAAQGKGKPRASYKCTWKAEKSRSL